MSPCVLQPVQREIERGKLARFGTIDVHDLVGDRQPSAGDIQRPAAHLGDLADLAQQGFTFLERAPGLRLIGDVGQHAMGAHELALGIGLDTPHDQTDFFVSVAMQQPHFAPRLQRAFEPLEIALETVAL